MASPGDPRRPCLGVSPLGVEAVFDCRVHGSCVALWVVLPIGVTRIASRLVR